MEDEDEDVVFQGSPLYSHLLQTGLREEDISPEPKQTTIREQHKDAVSGKASVSCFLEGCKNVWQHVFSGGLSSCGQLLEEFHSRRLVSTICSSKTLEEEDREFLQNYVGSAENSSHETQPTSLHYKILLVIVIPCLVAYGYSRYNVPELPWKYKTVTDISAILTVIYLLIKGGYSIYHTVYTRRLESKAYQIKLLVDGEESLLTCMKKSLRQIQEAELVARGFTLVGHKSPVSRLEQSHTHASSRQSPELRKLLFLTARSAMLKFRESTLNLVKICPLGADIDGSINYLSCVPTEEYGPCLQVLGEDEEAQRKLADITDGFSIAVLKGMKQLFLLHQSEFLKRLALSLHPQMLDTATHSFPTVLLNPKCLTLVTELRSYVEALTSPLQWSYIIHSSGGLEREPVRRRNIVEASPYSDLYVAVHSLDLHLQAALTRVRCLSSWIEKVTEEMSTENHTLSHDALNNFLQPVKSELESCKGCWEEGIARIQKLQKSSCPLENKFPVATDTSSVEEVSRQPIPLFEMGDPIIEDQVFEGYTDPDDVELGDYDWEPLSKEDKERKKREKEESIRLLTELKSVISVRAADREQRERRALEKAKPTGTPSMQGDMEDNENEEMDRHSDSVNPERSGQNGVNEINLNKQDPSYEKLGRPDIVELGISTSKEDSMTNIEKEQEIDDQTELESVFQGSDALERREINLNGKHSREGAKTGYCETAKLSGNDFSFDSVTPGINSLQGIGTIGSVMDNNKPSIENPYGKQKKVLQPLKVAQTSENAISTPCEDQNSDEERLNSELSDQGQTPRNESLPEKLARLSGADLPFTSSLAAMAAARSQTLGLSEQTFGDSSEEEDGDDKT